jgi:hypothetical protein
MILPGARDIVTEAGDRACFVSLGSGNWYCQEFLKANGRSLGDRIIVTHSATEATTADKLRAQEHLVTGAYTITLPAMSIGMSARFMATTAAVLTLDCTSPNYFVLAGTALTAGNKIQTSGAAGAAFEIVCLETNKLYVINANDVLIDGGA